MNEHSPKQNQPEEPISQENELGNETRQLDLGPNAGAQEGQLESQPDVEADAGQVSLSGLGKAVTRLRLANTERQLLNNDRHLQVAKKKSAKRQDKRKKRQENLGLDPNRIRQEPEEHSLTGFQAWRSEARKARMGRLGVRRIGLVTTYGEKHGMRFILDRNTVPQESSYYAADNKLTRLERPMNNLVTHDNTLESRQEALTEHRDKLRGQLGQQKEAPQIPQELEPVTLHSQYRRVLEQAKTTDSLSTDEITTVLDEKYANDPRRVGILVRKLQRDGVLSEGGAVLKSADEIDALTATPVREGSGRDPAIGRRSEAMPDHALLAEYNISRDDISYLSDTINKLVKEDVKKHTEQTGQKLTDNERAELEADIRDDVVRSAFAEDEDEVTDRPNREDVIQATKNAVVLSQRSARGSGRQPSKRDIDNAVRTLERAGMLDGDQAKGPKRSSQRQERTSISQEAAAMNETDKRILLDIDQEVVNAIKLEKKSQSTTSLTPEENQEIRNNIYRKYFPDIDDSSAAHLLELIKHLKDNDTSGPSRT